MSFIIYKNTDHIDKNEFERKIQSRIDQTSSEQQDNDDPYMVFFKLQISIDEFKKFDIEEQVTVLQYLSDTIIKSLEKDETKYAQWIYTKSNVPQLILQIFQETDSILVLEYVLYVIFQWIRCFGQVDIWITDELLVYLFYYATAISENATSKIFERSINILIKLLNDKKDELKKFFSLKKIINRTINSFKENQFARTREYLSEFLDAIFINIKEFDENDVFPLGDIFSMLPYCTDAVFFPSLMNCAINICEQSANFGHKFAQNVDVVLLFSQISDTPSDSRRSIIGMIIFFLFTRDQIMIQSFMPSFQWSWLLPMMQNPEEDSDPNLVCQLVVELILTFPDLSNQPDVKGIIEYFCILINFNDYVNKLIIFKYISKLFSIQNPNIVELLIQNDFIEIAANYLISAEADAIVCIINSLHYIALFAEVKKISKIIERMDENEIFIEVSEHTQSEDQNISEAALAFLNDPKLKMVQNIISNKC